MRFSVLGPLRIEADRRVVDVRAGMHRRLLAVLLSQGGGSVSTEGLVDALWPEEPPANAVKTVQVYVARLRQALGAPERIERRGGGYAVRVRAGELDSAEFNELVEQAARAVPGGRLADAEESLDRAVALWRGAPYQDAADCTAVRPEIQRLVEWRARALELRADVGLRRGRHAELVPELSGLVAEFPHRERLVGQLMVALYRSDRQADALEAFRAARFRLDEELGVEPGAELQRLHEQVLRCDPVLDPPSEPESPRTASYESGESVEPTVATAGPAGPQAARVDGVVPAQLPPDLASLTGRDAEVDELVELATDHPDAHGTLVVSAIDGMAGIGKTVLAVRAAHRLADRYPDGQLFLDLHGFTEGIEPVEPNVALDRLLRSVGVPGDRIPHDLEERTALWRSTCVGKRWLILLDNAMSESQVQPLLPAEPGCLVLITSRRRLSGLDDVLPVSLDVLGISDAGALFDQVAGTARMRRERRAAEGDGEPADRIDEEVAAVVELCGRLPLAIRLAASRFRARPTWRLADLIGRLEDERRRLEELEAGERTVAGAFALSYEHLGAEQQRMFRLLGLFPGGDFDAYAAAALADVGLHKAEHLLEELVDLHLIQPMGYGRYGFHDLLRAHAATIVEEAEPEELRHEAQARLTDYYLCAVSLAMDAYDPASKHRRPGVPPASGPVPAFSNRVEATVWLEAEQANVIAAVGDSRTAASQASIIALSRLVRSYLERSVRVSDAIQLHSAAQRCAQQMGNEVAEGHAASMLAATYRLAGRHDEALALFSRASDLAKRTRDAPLEATVSGNMAMTLDYLGRLEDAGYEAVRAVEIDVRLKNETGASHAARVAARVMLKLDRPEDAERLAAQAVDFAEASSSVSGRANACMTLGLVYAKQGAFSDALVQHDRALQLYRESGAKNSEAFAFVGMGEAECGLGRYDRALERFETVRQIAVELADRNIEFEARVGVGETMLAAGRPDEGSEQLGLAVQLARDLGQPTDEARALAGLGQVHLATGRSAEARECWERAIALYRQCGMMPTAERLEGELRSIDPVERR